MEKNRQGHNIYKTVQLLITIILILLKNKLSMGAKCIANNEEDGLTNRKIDRYTIRQHLKTKETKTKMCHFIKFSE